MDFTKEERNEILKNQKEYPELYELVKRQNRYRFEREE